MVRHDLERGGPRIPVAPVAFLVQEGLTVGRRWPGPTPASSAAGVRAVGAVQAARVAMPVRSPALPSCPRAQPQGPACSPRSGCPASWRCWRRWPMLPRRRRLERAPARAGRGPASPRNVRDHRSALRPRAATRAPRVASTARPRRPSPTRRPGGRPTTSCDAHRWRHPPDPTSPRSTPAPALARAGVIPLALFDRAFERVRPGALADGSLRCADGRLVAEGAGSPVVRSRAIAAAALAPRTYRGANLVFALDPDRFLSDDPAPPRGWPSTSPTAGASGRCASANACASATRPPGSARWPRG